MSCEVKAPTQYLPEYVIIGGNTLKGIIPPEIPQTHVYGAIIAPQYDNYWEIRQKYPDLVETLWCMYGKESTYGTQMIGDNGLAYGHFQIHIDKHPVSEECAMDFSCSLKYTAEMIMAEKGYLWTTYNNCK